MVEHRRSPGWAYAALHVGQTLSAPVTFEIVFPAFHKIITNLGKRQTLIYTQHVATIGCAMLLHTCYWT